MISKVILLLVANAAAFRRLATCTQDAALGAACTTTDNCDTCAPATGRCSASKCVDPKTCKKNTDGTDQTGGTVDCFVPTKTPDTPAACTEAGAATG